MNKAYYTRRPGEKGLVPIYNLPGKYALVHSAIGWIVGYSHSSRANNIYSPGRECNCTCQLHVIQAAGKSEQSLTLKSLFSSPGRSPGRAIVLPPAAASALAEASALAKCYSFYVKVFYVIGKALSGKLSCPCDRSCLFSAKLENGKSFSTSEKAPIISRVKNIIDTAAWRIATSCILTLS